MLPARYDTLVGEGCPAAVVAEAFKNRKPRSIRLAASCRFAPERVGNLRKKWHTVDTAAFVRCSHLIHINNEPTCTPVPEVQGRSVPLPRGPAGRAICALRAAACVSPIN